MVRTGRLLPTLWLAMALGPGFLLAEEPEAPQAAPGASQAVPDQPSPGVTVRRPPGAPAPVDPRAFPEGVTPLAPRPDHPAAPRVKIQREPAPPAARPAPEPPAGEPDFDPPGAPFVGPRIPPDLGPETRVIGPTAFEQGQAFGRPPQPAGGPLPEHARWTPREGFSPPSPWPAGYPRPPARWIQPAIDPAWEPTPAWPPGQDLRNWSPVTWIVPVIDPTWVPTDAWGRTVDFEEATPPSSGPQTTGEQPSPPQPEPAIGETGGAGGS